MSVLAKVFVITKDEYDLIEDFIMYYSKLVGLENIVIIDNNSTHPKVLSVYDKYLSLGLGALHKHSSPMQLNGNLMSQYLHMYKPHCKFMIPLDTDEFIFLLNAPITKENFEKELLSIPDDVSVIRFNNLYASVPDPTSPSFVGFKHVRPAKNITNFYEQNWDKVFVRADPFQSIVLGNHNASVAYGKKQTSSSLALLHFHETGCMRQFERAFLALQSYNYMSPSAEAPTQLMECMQHRHSVGGHHCSYMINFILRVIFLNKWTNLHGHVIPDAEHINWINALDVNANSAVGLENQIAQYVESSVPTNATRLDDVERIQFLFGNWSYKQGTFVCDQVSNILE